MNDLIAQKALQLVTDVNECELDIQRVIKERSATNDTSLFRDAESTLYQLSGLLRSLPADDKMAEEIQAIDRTVNSGVLPYKLWEIFGEGYYEEHYGEKENNNFPRVHGAFDNDDDESDTWYDDDYAFMVYGIEIDTQGRVYFRFLFTQEYFL